MSDLAQPASAILADPAPVDPKSDPVALQAQVDALTKQLADAQAQAASDLAAKEVALQAKQADLDAANIALQAKQKQIADINAKDGGRLQAFADMISGYQTALKADEAQCNARVRMLSILNEQGEACPSEADLDAMILKAAGG